MALLGQSINPALFLQDYSGFAKAGAIQAQGMQNLGQQIQQAAGDYAANKKEAGKLAGIKKAGIADIEAAIKLSESSGLGLESSLQPLLAAANDPNSSLMEQAAVAQQGSSSIANLMNTKFKVDEMNMQRQAAAQSNALNAAKIAEIGNDRAKSDIIAEAIGPAFLKAKMAQLPAEIRDSIATQSTNLTAKQQFDLGQELERTFPGQKPVSDVDIKTFKTPDGREIQLQLDPLTGSYGPIKTSLGIPGLGVSSPPLSTTNIPAGYEAIRTAGGGLIVSPIPGSPDYIARQKAEEAAAGQKEQRDISGGVVIQDAMRALEELKNVNPDAGILASNVRSAASKVAGTPEYKIINNYVPTILANITFDKLQELKQNSPTGASGLGALNMKEADSLRDSAGKLTDISDPKIFAENLIRVQSKFVDLVHGTSAERQKLVDDGKLSRAENIKIESLYPDVQMSASGKTIPRGRAETKMLETRPEVQAIIESRKQGK